MNRVHIEEAITQLEKANADLDPELLSVAEARTMVQAYARAQRLTAFGIAALARRIDDASGLAAMTGTSAGTAKQTIATSAVLNESPPLNEALKQGAISLEQAVTIASAEQSAPGAAADLVAVATAETFHVLKERARKVKLEAEQQKDLAGRQRAARRGWSYCDDLGMVNIHLRLQPHAGTPIVKGAEAEGARLYRAAQKDGRAESFERHLADAYAAMLAGSGTGRAARPELVVVVSRGVAKRGWNDVTDGEVCTIPGVGPVAPEVAKEIAGDAFLTGVFYDGKDLRHIRRWTRSIPVEVRIALELGTPPGFDGVRCVDCGNGFRTEFDHVEPRAAHGPTSHGNLSPRCWRCHQAKTKRDRRAGRLKPAEP